MFDWLLLALIFYHEYAMYKNFGAVGEYSTSSAEAINNNTKNIFHIDNYMDQLFNRVAELEEKVAELEKFNPDNSTTSET